ncbi:isocitrate dehydrogenase (NAD(+)) idh1 [Coelomomyces lativittatus]|nr:isocitrate dehydrogenase (NAD(+)) idh1 [Coelomomyces lativittatus]KAJ1512618.1 isocitrate dehydrogenase (NAD(+)) idh1 [Coelomomyces lativittatus]KAJ1517743.1 isocitrate dehydrogenase (NAD(+)) idh1 [Coelomomyces lativittatus]
MSFSSFTSSFTRRPLLLPCPARKFGSLSARFMLPGMTQHASTCTKYAGTYTVTLIPGDGVGIEMTNSVKDVFKAINVPVLFEQYNITGDTKDPGLMKAAMDALKRTKVGLKGILFTPYSKKSTNVAIRKELDLYASISMIKSIPGYAPRENVDFAIIRENTEGEYAGMEHQPYPGVVESLKLVTKAKTERIAQFAFDFALHNGRKKVTCVHKANIMKLGDGLFLNTCKEMAQKYVSAGIQFEDMIVDNTAMQLVSKPTQFDVLVMGNLYGNIVSNIGAALVGGPGIVPGANLGREYALFEPGCRHVGKDIEGRNLANPSAMLLSAVAMLRHLHLDTYAEAIANAVFKTLSTGQVRTSDMGGKSSTTEFTKAVIQNLKSETL